MPLLALLSPEADTAMGQYADFAALQLTERVEYLIYEYAH